MRYFLSRLRKLCTSHAKEVKYGLALRFLREIRSRPFVRLLIDSPRRLRLLKRANVGQVGFRLGLAEGFPPGKRTILASGVFEINILDILCMQPNPLIAAKAVRAVELSWKDLWYLEGLPRTKDFYSLDDTISFGEVRAALLGHSELTEFLSRITRFGPQWAVDREPRTLFLLNQREANVASLGFTAIVDVLSDGSIVLQDGHHRASLALLAGRKTIYCRLRA